MMEFFGRFFSKPETPSAEQVIKLHVNPQYELMGNALADVAEWLNGRTIFIPKRHEGKEIESFKKDGEDRGLIRSGQVKGDPSEQLPHLLIQLKRLGSSAELFDLRISVYESPQMKNQYVLSHLGVTLEERVSPQRTEELPCKTFAGALLFFPGIKSDKFYTFRIPEAVFEFARRTSIPPSLSAEAFPERTYSSNQNNSVERRVV